MFFVIYNVYFPVFFTRFLVIGANHRNSPSRFREVYPVENGDADGLFLERLPGDLFEVPEPSDPAVLPVRLVVNGVLGGLVGSTVLGTALSGSLAMKSLKSH